MKNIAIYNRCSTEEECQINALAVQAEESREIARQMGWNILEQYVESQSGTTVVGRTEYLRMIEDIEAGKFDIVMIKSIDRLARNAKDWYLFLDCIVRNNTRLYLYLERKFYASDDALITGIKAILAEQFSKELSEKIKNAHKRRQEKRSGYNITREMFGWDKVERDVYQINEEEAYYFRLACSLVEQGYGFRRIGNRMYELGARNKNAARISEVQWRKMLRSPRAHGTVVLHSQEYDFETKKRKELPDEERIYVENALPPIITKEYHEKILALLDQRSREAKMPCRSGHAGRYEFSGRIVCAECGEVYYRVSTSGGRGRRAEWKCARYMREGNRRNETEPPLGCSNIKLEEESLRELLGEACRLRYPRSYGTEDGLTEETIHILEKIFDSGRMRKESERVRQRLLGLSKDKERLMKKLLCEVISDEDYRLYKKRIEEETASLEARRNVINEELSKYNNHETRLKDIKERLGQADFLEKVKTRELTKRIGRILVHADGKLEALFAGSAGGGKDIVKLQYRQTRAGEKLRREQREAVYSCIKENRKIKIAQAAEMLGMKESAVQSRIRELKAEGRLEYKRGCLDGGWLLLKEEEACGEH